MVLVLALGTSAFAASITINHDSTYTGDTNTDEETYHYYKVFDAVVPSGHEITDTDIESAKSGTATGFTYKIANDSPFKTTLATFFDYDDEGDGTSIATLKSTYEANATTAQSIAAALAPLTTDGGGSVAQTGDITPGTAVDVDTGYYLIISSVGEKMVLATTDVTITEKNQFPSIDKSEKDADKDSYVGVGNGTEGVVDVAVGDTITYQVTVTVPSTANQTITVTDTMSGGLTFDYANVATVLSAKIGDDACTDYNVVTADCSERGWKVEIPADDTTKGKTIVFTFTATVNSDAITDSDKENEVVLDYSNFQQKDAVNYELVNAGIHKYDGNTNADLEDVEFELQVDGEKIKVAYNDTDKYYYPDSDGDATISTDSEGKVVIRGLDKDKVYKLHETKPLDGYNTLATDVPLTLTVDPAGATDPAFDQVENNKGTELPSTGGIGTTIFYIVGGILIVGAGVVLVTKKRVGEE